LKTQNDEVSTGEPFDGEEYVRWAYRLLLGREPENLAAVQNNPYKNDRQRLVETVLNSAEFHCNSRAKLAAPSDNPYLSWTKDAVAFLHLPKTGGTSLFTLLSACFLPDRICPQHYNALHLYPPAELAKYDFFSGHFDYFALRFIPRQRVRCLSIFRDPVQRLISFYRFAKSFKPNRADIVGDLSVKMANELAPEEFFEHDIIVSSPFINNTYLFVLGSSLDDLTTCRALASAPRSLSASSPNDRATAAKALINDNAVVQILERATQRILELDAIGLTEMYAESVETVFTTLGFPVPRSIIHTQVTDELANTDTRFSRVPPVEMTTRLSRALSQLTEYDQIIYDVAKREFERRYSGAVLMAPNPTGYAYLPDGRDEA
jgi:Sulfotransferase family